VARLTYDVDIALPADRIDEFLRVTSVSGFEILPQRPGRWPKVRHKETGIKVDVLPEGAQPGAQDEPAPTNIPHPVKMGAKPGPLSYITLASLVELKLAAGRLRDQNDVLELIRSNETQLDSIRQHLATVHPNYVQAFDRIVEQAKKQRDE
jgi:hypothetical protein